MLCFFTDLQPFYSFYVKNYKVALHKLRLQAFLDLKPMATFCAGCAFAYTQLSLSACMQHVTCRLYLFIPLQVILIACHPINTVSICQRTPLLLILMQRYTNIFKYTNIYQNIFQYEPIFNIRIHKDTILSLFNH